VTARPSHEQPSPRSERGGDESRAESVRVPSPDWSSLDAAGATVAQHVRAIDYRTNKVELPPHSSHSDYFDLGAFLPGFDPERIGPANVPPDFEPILKFDDSWGHELWIDRHGLHDGRWKHRDEDRLAEEFGYKIQSSRTLVRRRTWRRRWQTEIREPRPLV
jgi:hypothetical protein